MKVQKSMYQTVVATLTLDELVEMVAAKAGAGQLEFRYCDNSNDGTYTFYFETPTLSRPDQAKEDSPLAITSNPL